MTNNTPARHPFLDDLTPEAELISTTLRKPVSGRENVKKVVEAVGSFYKSQAPTFFQSAGSRKLLQYDAVLGNGTTIHGTVVIEHNPDGSVPRVSVTFSPLDAALSLAGRLGALLDEDLGEGLFLSKLRSLHAVPLLARNGLGVSLLTEA
jgi:hypothetical protein